MKTICHLLFIALLTPFSGYCQDFSKQFFGEDFEYYKGLKLKFDESYSSELTRVFYTNSKDIESEKDTPVLYATKADKRISEIDSLKNKNFVVEDIIEFGEDFHGFKFGHKIVFKLREVDSDKSVYFKYNKYSAHLFPFLCEEFSFSDTDKLELCQNISRSVDDFTDEITYRSPISDPFYIIRYNESGVNSYYLRLTAPGVTLNVAEKGVIILFTDGTKWQNRSEDVDVDAKSSFYEYSSFIRLSNHDLKIFSEKTIDKYRLYIYDRTIDKILGEKFKVYVQCIQNQ